MILTTSAHASASVTREVIMKKVVDDPWQEPDREAKAKARLDAYVKKVVDQAPPLTDEQAARLAALLHTYRS